MTIRPIVIGAFGTVIKVLLKELEDIEIKGWVEPIQTNILLRTVKDEEPRRLEETYCQSNSS